MALAAGSKKSKTTTFDMPVASVLLESPQYAFDFFIEHFIKKWQVAVNPYREENRLGMIVDGRVFGCMLVAAPLSDSALSQDARDNVLWPDAEQNVSKHKAHLQVAMTREGDPIAAHVALTKVMYGLLRQKNVLGAYLRPGLFEPEYYVKSAENIAVKKLPTELWVHINQLGFDKGEGYSFFTTGMDKFGKSEFEIIETKANFIDAYYSLKELIRYTIENDAVFKDGDTIKAEGDGSNVAVSISKGVKVKGQTIKINL